MDAKEFIKAEVEKGISQTEIANKVGVSNATVYKMLYTNTTLTLATLKKIANAYGKPISFFITEEETAWERSPTVQITPKEKRLLELFRSLNERRQDRALDTLEDMSLAFRESRGSEPQEKNSAGLKSMAKLKD